MKIVIIIFKIHVKAIERLCKKSKLLTAMHCISMPEGKATGNVTFSFSIWTSSSVYIRSMICVFLFLDHFSRFCRFLTSTMREKLRSPIYFSFKIKSVESQENNWYIDQIQPRNTLQEFLQRKTLFYLFDRYMFSEDKLA